MRTNAQRQTTTDYFRRRSRWQRPGLIIAIVGIAGLVVGLWRGITALSIIGALILAIGVYLVTIGRIAHTAFKK